MTKSKYKARNKISIMPEFGFVSIFLFLKMKSWNRYIQLTWRHAHYMIKANLLNRGYHNVAHVQVFSSFSNLSSKGKIFQQELRPFHNFNKRNLLFYKISVFVQDIGKGAILCHVPSL